jgi:hypothetical protein
MNSKNPILQKAEQANTAKVQPELIPTFKKIVLAGEKLMYSPQTHKMMLQQMQSNPNPAEAAGEGIAKLFAILLRESKGTLNMKAAIPAMTVLLCEALGFMEDAGKAQVTDQLLADATREMGSALLQVLGVTPSKLQSMMANGKQMMPSAPSERPPAGIIASAQGA